MNCYNCKYELDSVWRFCPNCSHEIPVSQKRQFQYNSGFSVFQCDIRKVDFRKLLNKYPTKKLACYFLRQFAFKTIPQIAKALNIKNSTAETYNKQIKAVVREMFWIKE